MIPWSKHTSRTKRGSVTTFDIYVINAVVRPTKATIRLSAIKQNLDVAAQLAPQSKNIAVIKANAYGHGAVAVARALQDHVPAFAVAFIDEAVQLRDAGISTPILILQGTTCRSDVAEAAAQEFWLTLHNQEQVARVLEANTTNALRVWLKLETGMNRLGLTTDEIELALESLLASGNIRSGTVVCTHMACADDTCNALSPRQIEAARLNAGKLGLPVSIANSAGILAWPESLANWNRPGYMLYGNCPAGLSEEYAQGLVPAMTLTSEIIAIHDLNPGESVGYGQTWFALRPSRIGTIAIGYADGYPRHAANGTPVLVNGQTAPLVGRVSMDMTTVDLTGLNDIRVGDPVELWGQNLSVNEVASSAGTIGYELLAGLSGRIRLIHEP